MPVRQMRPQSFSELQPVLAVHPSKSARSSTGSSVYVSLSRH